MKKILLVTGAGTIGNMVAAQAVKGDQFEKIYLADVNPQREFIATLVNDPRVEVCRLDITDTTAVLPFFLEKGITHVIDTACIPHNAESRNLRAYIDVNAYGLANLLEAARLKGVDKYAYCSSNAVYDFSGPTKPDEPVNEDWPTLGPGSTLYDHTKRLGEKLVSLYRQMYGLPAASFRLTVIYGPCPALNMGSKTWFHNIIATAAMQRKLSYESIPRRRLCWMYARETANALVHAVLFEGAYPSQVYNVSSGILVGMEEIIEALKKVIPDLEVNIGLIKDVGWKFPLDISRMRQELGFTPRLTLDEAIREYVEWIWKHPQYVAGAVD
jgi:nucleoside-diphosphate-sugar epimerase